MAPEKQADEGGIEAARSRWTLIVLALATTTMLFGGWEIFERLYLADKVDVRTLHSLHTLRGIAASLLLAGVVAWYLLRGRLPVFPAAVPVGTITPLVDRKERLRRHVAWFVQMRWLAAGVTLALILIAVPVAGILPGYTLTPLLIWWIILVLANVHFTNWAREAKRPERQIMIQAMTDLVVLTGLLNASGGVENPLYIAYLFHVIIPGILLRRRHAITLTAIAASLFLGLLLGEYFGILPHHTNVLFPHGPPRVESGGLDHPHGAPVETGDHSHLLGAEDHDSSAPMTGAAEPLHAAHDFLFVIGRGLPFLLVMLLTSYFTIVVADRLRGSERDLEGAARAAMLEHERLERLIDASRVGMMLVAPDATVKWFSQRASGWIGLDTDQVDSRCPLYGSPGGCSRCIVEETATTGEQLEIEREAENTGGVIRHLRHATSPVRDESGRVVQVVEILEDVTRRKILEAEALHASKLSVLGGLAAGIAHEIGNPLSSLTTRLHLMERQQDPGFVRESLDILRRQINRIGRIVRGVSQFARRKQEGWSHWPLNDVVAEALGIVRLHRGAKTIEFREELENPSPMVRGVRDQISQVIVNLLLNAVEIMPDGGTVQVETFSAMGIVGFSVTDSGPGIDPSARMRLFEPFFTTKPDGTGLGLSVSYSLVHAHGGRIDVDSRSGKGSRFTVSLPVHGRGTLGAAGPPT